MSLQGLMTQLNETFLTVREFAPNIIGALLLVLVGWLLARFVRNWVKKLTMAMFARVGGDLSQSQHRAMVNTLVGTAAFWLVFLVFVAAGVEALGLPVVTGTLSRFVYFLPNALAAGLIVLVGLLVGDLARTAVSRALSTAGADQAAVAGNLARVATIAVALIVAIEEIGIDGQLLVILVAIVAATGLAGAGLAFGLGAHTAVSNIIASRYLPEGYREGRVVRIGDIEGRIIATTPGAVIIATADAQVTIPAKYFGEKISFLVSEEA